MSRRVYGWLLWLHPPAFRREFAGEMMWIFEEASAEGVGRLLADGAISLGRQWLLRRGLWKVAAALMGGLLEVIAGGLGGVLFRDAEMRKHVAPLPVEGPGMKAMIAVGMWAVAGVLVMVMLLALWVKSFNDRRLVGLAGRPRR